MRERERSRGRERGTEEREIPTRPRVCQLEHYYTPSGIREEENAQTTAFLLRSLSLSLFCVSLSLSLSPWHLILSYHRALVSCHLGPLPLFSTRLHDPTPTNLLLLLLSSTFPSRSHFRFNVGQLSRRAAGCANAADKRVFTRCR